MSISPSKPQSGHLSACEPDILGISICEEHSGHSTVIVSGISLLTTRFRTTFFLLAFLLPHYQIQNLRVNYQITV